MNASTLILAILNVGEATGYEIKKMTSEGRFSHFIDMSFGSIYPTLAKLETEGFVCHRIETQSGKPDRKVFSLTDAGREEFILALSQPPARDKFKSEFLMIAMNAELTAKASLERAIVERVTYLHEQIEMLEDVLADCNHAATRWVAEYGLNCMNSDLDYLNSNKDQLLALADAHSQGAPAIAAG